MRLGEKREGEGTSTELLHAREEDGEEGLAAGVWGEQGAERGEGTAALLRGERRAQRHGRAGFFCKLFRGKTQSGKGGRELGGATFGDEEAWRGRKEGTGYSEEDGEERLEDEGDAPGEGGRDARGAVADEVADANAGRGAHLADGGESATRGRRHDFADVAEKGQGEIWDRQGAEDANTVTWKRV